MTVAKWPKERRHAYFTIALDDYAMALVLKLRKPKAKWERILPLLKLPDIELLPEGIVAQMPNE